MLITACNPMLCLKLGPTFRGFRACLCLAARWAIHKALDRLFSRLWPGEADYLPVQTNSMPVECTMTSTSCLGTVSHAFLVANAPIQFVLSGFRGLLRLVSMLIGS